MRESPENMTVDSPNIDTLDAWAFEVRRVEKPWGHELANGVIPMNRIMSEIGG